MTSRLSTQNLSVGYGGAAILKDLSLCFPDAQITAVVGPNACGKSTLLRTLARLIKPMHGAALLDGQPVHTQNTRKVAQTLALLPQVTEATEGMRVADLVARGRTPHQNPLQQWSHRDERAISDALSQVGLADHKDALLEDLSGGQRQRAWIAMVLAQATPILLLDEPTTYLDLRYQIETLKLIRHLRDARDLTVVMVLHEINLAARFADWIIALKGGESIVEGTPSDVITVPNIEAIYDLPARIISDPNGSTPHVIPL